MERKIVDNVEVDWFIHAVFDNDKPGLIVYHTHGMEQYTDGYELELNLCLKNEDAMTILNTLGLYIKKGLIKLEQNKPISNIFLTDFYLLEVEPIFPHEENEKVLRVILQDKNGKYPWNTGCDKGFRDQV